MLSVILVAVTVTIAAQRVVPGWAEPEPGALLSVVWQERVTPQQIDTESVPFFSTAEIPQIDSFRTLSARFGADVYRLVYWTSDADGSPVRASASLYIPVSSEPHQAPVLAFGSGTTGLGDDCAPSLENPRIVRLGWYRSNMLAYAGQGIMAIFPDYVGFNDPSIPQRYFSKFSEGYLMLDSIRAARSAAASLGSVVRTNTVPGPRSFTAGYSQGGHAALAAADLWRSYAPELDLRGVIGFGSTPSVEALFRDAGWYPPNIIYSYLQLYGNVRVRPAEILRAEWARDLELDVLSRCVTEFQAYYPANPASLFTPRFYDALMSRRLGEFFPSFKAILDENESGLDGHGVDTLYIQGLEDWIASTASNREYVDRLRATGVDVEYIEYEFVRHRYTRPAGFVDSVNFIWARMN